MKKVRGLRRRNRVNRKIIQMKILKKMSKTRITAIDADFKVHIYFSIFNFNFLSFI